MPAKTESKSATTVAANSDGQAVSGFMKPATILFGLALLSIGGIVFLYIKFRSMDKQIRVLTKQVAEVPSEHDFRMAQESWAKQFYERHAEQNRQVMDRLESLAHMAEATRAHLHQLENRNENSDDCSDCSESAPTFRVDTSQLESVVTSLIPEDAGIANESGPIAEDADIASENGPIAEDADIASETGPVAEDAGIASETGPVAEDANAEDSADDDDMPEPVVKKVPLESGPVEESEPASQTQNAVADVDDPDSDSGSLSGSLSGSPSQMDPNSQTPTLRLPNAFIQSVQTDSSKTNSAKKKEREAEEVLESSIDLDADESELDTE